jgi:hypothetical protein
MRRVVALIAALVFAAPANAQFAPGDKTTIALNNLGHELVVCIAFFYITAIGNLNRGDEAGQKMAKTAQSTGDYLFQVAGIIGEAIGQKPEALGARLEMAVADMRKQMADNFVNYSIPLQRHLEPCAELAKTAQQRVATALNAQ